MTLTLTTTTGTAIPVKPDSKHEWLLESKLVAQGYGIDESTLRKHRSRHSSELIQGKHWVRTISHTLGGRQEIIEWTKRGVVRLGFFIKSKKASYFRDAAEDLVIGEDEKATAPHHLPSRKELAQMVIAYEEKHGITSEIMDKVMPIGKYGEPGKNGVPKLGVRRAAFVAAASRYHDAAKLMELSGQLELEGLE